MFILSILLEPILTCYCRWYSSETRVPYNFNVLKWVFFFTIFFQIGDITIGSLDDVPGGPVTMFFRSIRNTLDFDFEDENEGQLQDSSISCF